MLKSESLREFSYNTETEETERGVMVIDECVCVSAGEV